MFEKISNKWLKRLFLWKYFFQFFITPLFLWMLFIGPIIILLGALKGFYDTIILFFAINGNGKMNGSQAFLLVMYFCSFPGIASIPTFIKLIFDCIKNQEVEQVTKITKLFPCIELPSLRQKKRFTCDTFSKKKNVEIYVYDEAGKKYRFFWNENYGGSSEEVERVLLEGVTVKIKYLKYSKIIVACEILNDEA